MTDREMLLEWAKEYCNNETLEDTGGFSMVLDKLSESMDRVGITSESLSDMSQSFGTETDMAIYKLLSPYRRLKAI